MMASRNFESLELVPEAAVAHWNRPPSRGHVESLRYPVHFDSQNHGFGASFARMDFAV